MARSQRDHFFTLKTHSYASTNSYPKGHDGVRKHSMDKHWINHYIIVNFLTGVLVTILLVYSYDENG